MTENSSIILSLQPDALRMYTLVLSLTQGAVQVFSCPLNLTRWSSFSHNTWARADSTLSMWIQRKKKRVEVKQHEKAQGCSALSFNLFAAASSKRKLMKKTGSIR